MFKKDIGLNISVNFLFRYEGHEGPNCFKGAQGIKVVCPHRNSHHSTIKSSNHSANGRSNQCTDVQSNQCADGRSNRSADVHPYNVMAWVDHIIYIKS